MRVGVAMRYPRRYPREGRLRLLGCILRPAVLLAAPLATRAQPGNGLPTPDSGGEGAVLAAIARAVADSLTVPLVVDPRALRPDPAIADPSHKNFAPLAQAEVERRVRVLQGVKGDVTVFDTTQVLRCRLGIAPAPGPPVGCPARPFALAVIGLSRAGGAYLPFSGVDERRKGGERGQRAARVLLTQYTPRGGTVTVYDYVVQRNAPGWSVLRGTAVLSRD